MQHFHLWALQTSSILERCQHDSRRRWRHLFTEKLCSDLMDDVYARLLLREVRGKFFEFWLLTLMIYSETHTLDRYLNFSRANQIGVKSSLWRKLKRKVLHFTYTSQTDISSERRYSWESRLHLRPTMSTWKRLSIPRFRVWCLVLFLCWSSIPQL